MKNWLLNNLLAIPVEKDIFYIDKTGRWYIGDKLLQPNEVQQLKEEAIMLSKMQLPKLLDEKITKAAHVQMFKNSKNFEDMLGGKFILYTLSIRQKLLYKIIDTNLK